MISPQWYFLESLGSLGTAMSNMGFLKWPVTSAWLVMCLVPCVGLGIFIFRPVKGRPWRAGALGSETCKKAQAPILTPSQPLEPVFELGRHRSGYCPDGVGLCVDSGSGDTGQATVCFGVAVSLSEATSILAE